MNEDFAEAARTGIVFGGEIRFYRNAKNRKFAEHDRYCIETKWKSLAELPKAYAEAVAKERSLAERREFAWDPEFGYLSPDPRHIGTGLVLNGLFHLEGINLIGDMKPTLDGLRAVRFTALSRGSESIRESAHLYTVTNDATLGTSEARLFERTERIFRDLAEREYWSRRRLVEEYPRVLDDSISRALAIMTNCRLLSSWELMDMLSPVRLGCLFGFIDGITLADIDEFILNQYRKGVSEDAPETLEEERTRDTRDAQIADQINVRIRRVALNDYGLRMLKRSHR